MRGNDSASLYTGSSTSISVLANDTVLDLPATVAVYSWVREIVSEPVGET